MRTLNDHGYSPFPRLPLQHGLLVLLAHEVGLVVFWAVTWVVARPLSRAVLQKEVPTAAWTAVVPLSKLKFEPRMNDQG